MKKTTFVTAISFAFLMLGCAQKTVDTVDVNDGVIEGEVIDNGVIGVIDDGTIYGDDYTGSTYNRSGEYENVDLYGRNNNINGGGGYTYNRDYGDSSSSANGGIRNIYFNVNQYTITSDKLSVINSNARALNSAVRSGSRVKIEGHCDASGTDEYNYALGLRRAKSAKDAIVSRGVNPATITMVSMGESSPECTTGYSSDCYAKNRRVEFKVIR